MSSPEGLADYLADWPRTGIPVRIHLDGAKPHNFDRFVAVRDLGRWGLVERSGRFVVVDQADLDELADEAHEALHELIDVEGEKLAGPQTSLRAIVSLLYRIADERRHGSDPLPTNPRR